MREHLIKRCVYFLIAFPKLFKSTSVALANSVSVKIVRGSLKFISAVAMHHPNSMIVLDVREAKNGELSESSPLKLCSFSH